MMKIMTTTMLAGTLLLGLATSAFAARTPDVPNRHEEIRASRLAGDPAQGRTARSECSIEGSYHDTPYCFGGDQRAY
jgi:uncharacterized low-complexity protein